MSKLPSNARRTFLWPANQRPLNGLASSRIIGVALPVTIVSTYSTTAHFAPFCPAGLAGACDRPNHRTLGPLSSDGVARLNGRDGLSRLDTGAYDWCSLSALPRIPTAQADVLP